MTGDGSSPSQHATIMDLIDAWSIKIHKHAFQTVVLPAGGIAASLILTGNASVLVSWMLLPSWNFLLRILGTALGIGLGLGLAAHVHDRLELWHARHEADIAAPAQVRSTSTKSSWHRTSSSTTGLQDEASYAALMTMAGYDVSDNVLRGQIVKREAFFQPNYSYTRLEEDQQMGPTIMTQQWPHLPPHISHELGRWIEHIIRDYVASWYSILDAGCPYQDEKARRKSGLAENTPEAEQEASDRAMVFSTARHRPLPMMTAMYHSLAIVFGNLSSRAEHVNVFSLVLLKWTRVLGQTMKTYRRLRLLALTKMGVHLEEKPHVSEMRMTKEFLLAGKLHRAVCFGLDVPSLLFADASGKECGVDGRALDDMTGDQVLEERLFNTKMLFECEMDYNRVLGHRLCRALLPRSEFSSPIIRTLITEIMSGCVLTPLMGIFSPDYVNSWICSGLEAMLASKAGEAKTGEEVAMHDWENDVEESGVEVPLESQTNGDAVKLGAEMPPDSQDNGDLVESGMEMPLESQGNGDVNESGVEMPLETRNDSGAAESKTEENHCGEVSPQHHEAIEVIANDSEDHSDHGDDIDHSSEGSHDNDTEKRAISSSNGRAYESSEMVSGEYILPLLTMAIIDLQRFVDFDENRKANASHEETGTNWDAPECQEAVRQVVLVLEAALIHGRRKHKLHPKRVRKMSEAEDEIPSADSDDCSFLPFDSSSFSQVLMELTSDVNTFEGRIVAEEIRLENARRADPENDESDKDTLSDEITPTASELSTLRTLIAAWLHTGQVYRTVYVLIQARRSILAPYFNETAFLRDEANAAGLAQQLKTLDEVEIMVDTTSILDSDTLDMDGKSSRKSMMSSPQPKSVTIQAVSSQAASNQSSSSHLPPRGASLSMSMSRSSGRLQRFISGNSIEGEDLEASISLGANSPTPRYLDFRRNESFASSLRAERERRTQSWLSLSVSMADQGLKIVHRYKGSSEQDKELHRGIHRLARTFYSGTNLIALRDGTRRKEAEPGESTDQSESGMSKNGEETDGITRVSLLTVDMGGTRRKLEIPDDDSSFLIRAQPRPLKAKGVHVDQRDHGQSYQTFLASYEEPAFRPGSRQYSGGRYIRPCTLKYFPNDHTATVEVPTEPKKLDQRRSDGPPTSITVSALREKSLSGDFLRKRHLCQKWVPRGAAPRSGGSILANPAMEPADFHSVPRSGKSVDFAYRMSLFECPMVELSGKRFTVHDSSPTGTFRADASAMELSDASLSNALLTAGRDWESLSFESANQGQSTVDEEQLEQKPKPGVEMGPDGYPIVWIKLHQKQDEKVVTEIKPFRASYVRAALLVASTRHEAQRTCLLMCARAGSVRNATRSRVDSLLIPTQRLLEFANSPDREKQSIVMRDLKLGINHIDRDQLRRNKLLYPRYPTLIRTLSAGIEGLMHVKDTGMTFVGASPTTVVYRIRCIAIVELIDTDEDCEELPEYDPGDGSKPGVFREEWVVYRQFRDFNILHKQLKTQVAATETSGTAGSRLVGAATAAFAVGGAPAGSDRRRENLIPSLGQANKAGALGITKKAVQKRRAILHSYLQHLLSPNHPMKHCSEILTFLGAFHAFPPEVPTGTVVYVPADFLGRIEMTRSVYSDGATPSNETKGTERSDTGLARASSLTVETAPMGNLETPTKARRSLSESYVSTDESGRSPRVKEIDMDPAIRAKIDQVPLSKVRSAIFDLIRSHFDFENASFFRNRVLTALKTVSFAIASNSEFRKTLYNFHTENLNADSIAGLIKTGLDLLWPDGVLFDSSPPLTPEESMELADKAKKMLKTAFPDQVRSILGVEIVQDGVDLLHEMLQNRIVCKSLFYMFWELLLLELFPELQDILSCGSVLET